jgi:hypothetical protein
LHLETHGPRSVPGGGPRPAVSMKNSPGQASSSIGLAEKASVPSLLQASRWGWTPRRRSPQHENCTEQPTRRLHDQLLGRSCKVDASIIGRRDSPAAAP